ncbi:MAG: hypothetical protein IH586_13160, partial [Anaerolineaceae bacterium]|nr:hypothetical protein [Anaerolineaceae bacterium]
NQPAFSSLITLRSIIVGGAVTLAGFASLVAIWGLVGAHWHKLRARRNPDRYSFFMLLGFFITFGFGLYAYLLDPGKIASFQLFVNAFQVPVESSLMALLAIVLTMASFRLFQRRRGFLPIVFAVSVLVFLLLNSGLLHSQQNVPFLDWILDAIHSLPVAGARGILLGIALGSLLAGLRILFGAERPYSG